MALTQEQIDFFHANGYLKIGPILKKVEIQFLREQYDEEFRQAVEGNSFRNISQDDGGDVDHKLKTDKQMFQIMQMCERNIHFRKLLFKPDILDLVQDLIGPNIMLFHDQALFIFRKQPLEHQADPHRYPWNPTHHHTPSSTSSMPSQNRANICLDSRNLSSPAGFSSK